MTARRTAATATTAFAALAAGAVLLASAGTAAAQDRPDRGTGPVPRTSGMHEMNGPGQGMARMHDLHAQQNPGWERMHQLHIEQNPGMARMHQQMTNGPR